MWRDGRLLIRIFDILFSSLALIILAPLFIIICTILRCSGEGEILYKQERIGQNNKKFKLIKFATMLKNSPNIGSGSLTVRNDPRVLPFGKALRKTKINELPQLINILMGDMSLVGPRPLHEIQFMYYSNEVQRTVSSVRPGLTGAASIIFRDEEKYFVHCDDPQIFYRDVISPAKGLIEMWYVKHINLLLYFKLIFFTIYAIIRPNINLTYLIDSTTRDKVNELLE